MADPNDDRLIPRLVGDFGRQLSQLLHEQMALLRAEIREKISRLEKGGLEVGAGVVCLLVALIILLEAVIVALSDIIGAGWASLLVGIVVGTVGAVLVKMGMNKTTDLMPSRSARQARENIRTTREHL